MQKIIGIAFAALFIVTLVFPAVGITQIDQTTELRLESRSPDWWPMLGHDLQRTGFSTSSAPSTSTLLWGVGFDNHVDSSSPAIVDGQLYIGGRDPNGSVYCINITSGREIWQFDTDEGVYSSPAVMNGKVYIGCFNHNVYCLDAVGNGDGTTNVIWTYTTNGSTDSSPAIYNGNVYIGSNDGYMYCLNATGNGDGTTRMIWKFNTNNWVTSSPAIFDGKIYFGCMGVNFYCLDAQYGTVVWTFQTYSEVVSNPVVADGKVYVAAMDRNVYCLDAYGDGHGSTTVLWTHPTDGVFYSAPAIAYGKIYVGSLETNKFLCLDASTGDEIWNYTSELETALTTTSAAVADGKVFFLTYDKMFHCLNVENGSTIWEYKVPYISFSSPVITQGRVYLPDSWGLLVFGHRPAPSYSIDTIKGGPNVSAIITNIGDGEASAVQWDIFIRGGLFGFIDIHCGDTFHTLLVNGTKTVKTNVPVFGFGRVIVTVSVRTPGEMPVWTSIPGFVIGHNILILSKQRDIDRRMME